MSIQFAVLASGSGGNVTLVKSAESAILIDLGLGPRSLGRRLAATGTAIDRISAVLLTHPHGDHVSDAALALLVRRGIPLICHEGHVRRLDRFESFRSLLDRRLVRTFDDRPFLAPGGIRAESIALSHDGGPTFGFRMECKNGRRGRPVCIGLVTDSGTWWDSMADALAESDILAIEFNHDVELQRRSNRSPALIARNLGDRGHLSNEQGAGLLDAVLSRSRPGSVRHLVLMHLSAECNRPDLAIDAARGVLRRRSRRLTIHAARQEFVEPWIRVRPGRISAERPALALFPWEAA